MLGMKQSLTSGYHPQVDGQAERTIGTLKNTLVKMVRENHNKWDILLPYALWAYQTVIHATTKETPFFFTYGREATNLADLRISYNFFPHVFIYLSKFLQCNFLSYQGVS